MAGMARAMGTTLTGTQTCLAKIKFVICSYWNLYFGPHITINCKAASTQHPYDALSRTCCARTTKHHDKTVVLWRNTRTLWEKKNARLP